MKKLLLLLVLGMSISACDRNPEPIVYGKDFCQFCRMTILDQRFAVEVITKKGKLFKFDDLLCATEYCKIAALDSNTLKGIYATAFLAPHSFLTIEDALLVKSEELRSPMGGNVAAFALADSAHIASLFPDGRKISWPSPITANYE